MSPGPQDPKSHTRLIGVALVLAGGVVFLALASGWLGQDEQPRAAVSPSPTAPDPRPTTAADPSPAPTAIVSVKDYGAHADGVHDDRNAIVAASKAAAAAGASVYFPEGTYLLAGSLDAPPRVHFYSDAGAILACQGPLHASNGCTIEGLTFQSRGSRIAIDVGGSKTPAGHATVRDCSFVRGTTEFTWSRIIIWRGHDCVIDRNTFTGTSGSGANIWVVGGKRNHVTDNTIAGGTTAILFMWGKNSNGGGPDSIIEDSVITGNVYSGYSEEGISFDLMANSGECGAREYDTIAGVSRQTVTLSNLPFPEYVGYDIVFIDGALRGRTRTITAQRGNNFTVSGSLSGAAAGDHVTIGAPYKHNYIAYNTGTSAAGADPFAAIILYGLCFGNTIEHNTLVQGKIKVQSLDHVAIATGSATASHGRAPCGYNTVQDNDVSDPTGKIYLQYYALGGDYAPFISEGNNVIGNTTPLVAGEYQSAYFADNSGATSFHDVTMAATPFTYDGQ